MPKRATPQVHTAYWKFRKPPWNYSPGRAAKAVGMSEQWGYLQERRKREGSIPVQVDKDPPPPLSYEMLDGGVRDTLKDFDLFCETFFVRRPSVWRRDAAKRTVAWLLDDEQHFVDANVFPGAGKTTLFTHDIPVWLVCGGGSEDPAYGRALRILLGHETNRIATQYVMRARASFERQRPFYDPKQKREAELSLAHAFGRFKPNVTEGEQKLWTKDQFTVAQVGDLEVYEKEPTFQAASRESGFLGTRVDYYSWDDLVTKRNSLKVEAVESLKEWFEDEAEERLEPRGVGFLVGQRLSPIDLHQDRVRATYLTEHGQTKKKYHHIIYPAHRDDLCDGKHRQWNGYREGCLTDTNTMPISRWFRVQSKPNYRIVHQQEDVNPDAALVHPVWLEGGTDPSGYLAPGCMESDRGFKEWPRVPVLVDVVCVDPSVSGFWAIEWWAFDCTNPQDIHRYLIYGERRRMQAGAFLDWDPETQKHVGVMEEWQQESGELGHPIRLWIIEQNAAHKYLTQFSHFQTWRWKWPQVDWIPHQTNRNKNDERYGVEATLPMAYKTGRKHLPNKHGDMRALNYMKYKRKELTEYPLCKTDDTVMAEWFGEANIRRIVGIADGLRNYNSERIQYTSGSRAWQPPPVLVG